MPPNPKRKTPKLSRLLPERVARILGDQPTMAFEDDDDYDLLHAEMIVEYDPRDIQDHFLIKDIADAQWQLLRFREMLGAAVEIKLPQAVLNLLGKDYKFWVGTSWGITEFDLTFITRKALQGDIVQLKTLGVVADKGGVSLRHLKTEAFSLALSSVSALAELVAKAERRRDQAIKRLLDRRKYQEAMSHHINRTSGKLIELPRSDEPAETGPAEAQPTENDTSNDRRDS